MLVSDYRVLVTDEGDGIIAFLHNDITSIVLIPNTNTIAMKIFDKYHDQLSKFKYRYYAIAKWIVRDLRKEGFIFKALEDYPTIYVPIYNNKDTELSTREKFHWFYMELIKKRLSKTSLEKEPI
jgi:hypothetical protein